MWLSKLSAGLQTKGLPVPFPVKAHALVTSQVLGEGHARGNHTPDVSLPLSPSLPFYLKINKYFLKERKIKIKLIDLFMEVLGLQKNCMNVVYFLELMKQHWYIIINSSPQFTSEFSFCYTVLWFLTTVLCHTPTITVSNRRTFHDLKIPCALFIHPFLS